MGSDAIASFHRRTMYHRYTRYRAQVHRYKRGWWRPADAVALLFMPQVQALWIKDFEMGLRNLHVRQTCG